MTRALKIHKGLIIGLLERDPASFRVVAPEWEGDCESFLDEVRAAKGEWFVNGVLEEPDADLDPIKPGVET